MTTTASASPRGRCWRRKGSPWSVAPRTAPLRWRRCGGCGRRWCCWISSFQIWMASRLRSGSFPVRRSPRWSAEPSRGRVWLLLWPSGAVVGIAAEWRLYGWADPLDWVPDLLAGWAMIACGLAGWSRRPQSRSGALLAAAGFAWFAPNFAATGVTALGWLSAHALYLHRGPLVHLVLTYPRGRLVRRLDVAAVAVGYAV